MSAPILLSRKENAAGVAARWFKAYGIRKSGRDKDAIYEKLLVLGPEPNPDDVDSVIGNKLWTTTGTCCGCDEQPALVQVGHELDYDSSTAWLCKQCLKEACELGETA